MNFYEFFINATTEIPLFVVSYNPVCELRNNQMRIYIFTERHLKKNFVIAYAICSLNVIKNANFYFPDTQLKKFFYLQYNLLSELYTS